MRIRYVLISLALVLLVSACHSKKSGGGYFAPTPVRAR